MGSQKGKCARNAQYRDAVDVNDAVFGEAAGEVSNDVSWRTRPRAFSTEQMNTIVVIAPFEIMKPDCRSVRNDAIARAYRRKLATLFPGIRKKGD